MQTSEEISSEGTNPSYQERRKKKKRKTDISPTKCVRSSDKSTDPSENTKRMKIKDEEEDKGFYNTFKS